jgi:hypothetical protein
VTYGGPDVPDWIDDVFADMVGAAGPAHEMQAR